MKPMQFWVEHVCIDCATSGYGQWVIGRAIPVRTFQQEAKYRGWQALTSGEVRCPTCTRKVLVEIERMTGIELNKEPTP